MSAASVVRLSVEEYLEADRAAERPSEYHDGEMFPLEAATFRHGLLVNNVGSVMKARLRGGPCQIVNQIRVRVSPTKFVFPDQAITCERPAVTDRHEDTITNPKVIIEVLSPKTSGYDHDGKFALYCLLPSFEEYMLVAQDRPMVKVFRKTTDGRWLLSIYEGLAAIAEVESIGASLPLAELYEGVFNAGEAEPTP